MSNGPRDSYISSSPKKLQYSQPLMSPSRPKQTDPRSIESSEAEKFRTPSSASVVELPRHLKNDALKEEDSAERAFLELQDAKVNFRQEKMDHDTKMQERKTFSNGFGVNQTQTTNTSETAATGLA